MSWVTTVVVWLCTLWFAVQAFDSWKDIGRSMSPVSRWLHAFGGLASIAAAAIVWDKRSWSGIGLSVGLWLGATLIEMLAGRFWLIYLLWAKRSRDAEVFSRDP